MTSNRGSIDLPPIVIFRKLYFLERGKALFFVTFNIVKRHILPENFIEIPEVVPEI